jgi:hypothetical protein
MASCSDIALAGETDAMAKAAEVYKAANKVFLVNNGLPLPKSSLAAVIYRGNCHWEVQSARPKDAPNFDLLKKNLRFSTLGGKKYSETGLTLLHREQTPPSHRIILRNCEVNLAIKFQTL